MRRLVPVLALAVLIATLTAAPPAAAHESSIDYCSGYGQTASKTSSGTTITTETNVCVSLYAFSTTTMTWEAVVRKRCKINGAYSNRCRWDSYISLTTDAGCDGTWSTITQNNWKFPAAPNYDDNSGLHFTGHYTIHEDWNFCVRGSSNNSYVRMKMPDGTEPLVLESGRVSPTKFSD
jgi:hypothetical protein